MKVAQFTGLREIEIAEEPAPRITARTDVLVQIERVGVCGSDVHYYAEGGIGSQRLTYPASLGHECAGTVTEVGSAVKSLRPGDRVAVDPAISCGHCDQCRRGRLNTCRNIQFMGCPGEAPGAVAEYRVMPAENCFAIPDSMTLDEAALVEPLAIGLYCVRLAALAPGQRVGILGAGPIGLSVLLMARLAGPAAVYVTDLLDERLAIARQYGADWTGRAAGQPTTDELAALEPGGFDTVFECSGDPTAIDQATELLAPGGRLILVGIPGVPTLTIDPHPMRRKELTLRHVRRQNGTTGPTVRLVAEGLVNAKPLVTHRFALAGIRDAFELVAGYRDGVVKAMLELA